MKVHIIYEHHLYIQLNKIGDSGPMLVVVVPFTPAVVQNTIIPAEDKGPDLNIPEIKWDQQLENNTPSTDTVMIPPSL